MADHFWLSHAQIERIIAFPDGEPAPASPGSVMRNAHPAGDATDKTGHGAGRIQVENHLERHGPRSRKAMQVFAECRSFFCLRKGEVPRGAPHVRN